MIKTDKIKYLLNTYISYVGSGRLCDFHYEIWSEATEQLRKIEEFMLFTPNEMNLLLDFLDDLGDKLGDAGCNDFCLPDTPENREIVKRVDPDNTLSVYNGNLLTYDWKVLSYLKRKLESCYE